MDDIEAASNDAIYLIQTRVDVFYFTTQNDGVTMEWNKHFFELFVIRRHMLPLQVLYF